METTYRLTQTGKEVQDLLDQVTPNETAIAAETSRAMEAEQALSGDVSAEQSRAEAAEAILQGGINAEQSGRVAAVSAEEAARIAADAALQADLTAETNRATEAEQALSGDISAEQTRAEGAEATLQSNINAESSARQAADTTLQSNIDAEALARQGADATLQGNIDTEAVRAAAAEQANATAIAGIDAKIPAEASAQNQLADKSFVNSSVATATANFKGSYNLVTDLHLQVGATRAQIIAELGATIVGADNNDYCFVQIPVSNDKPTEIQAVDRYKYNGSAWAFEYSLNNSGFTDAQWQALNSGITSGLVSKLNALPTNSDLTTLLNGKQDNLTFDQIPTANSNNPVTSQGIKDAIDAISGGSSAALDAEIARAEAAEQSLQGNIDAEAARAAAAEQANATAIAGVDAKIPAEASAQNQLADKRFVNSSVATATATFRGTFNLVNDLHLTTSATRSQIASALEGAVATVDNNDYVFVQIPTVDATPNVIARVERYKFNGVAWTFEYELNNSGFTQDQWDAINSTITSGLVAKLNALPTNDDLTTLLSGKQDVINDLATIRSGATAGATAYQLPSTGVPKSDLAQGVQDSLEAADAAAPQSTTYTKTEVDGLIDAEETRAKAAEQANADDIDAIEAKIPSAATAQNQLADKTFVNSSIATSTATYRGSYNLVNDLGLTISATHAQIAAALGGTVATADNNDYCFVQIPAANDTPSVIRSVDRYKFNGTAWNYEFTLNNSGFTQAQWDAINSGITSGLVAKLNALPAIADLTSMFATKQDVLTFDQTPTANSNNPVTSGGIKGAIDSAIGAEETRAKAAERVNALAIDDVEALIPNAATAQNQLADKAFVNNAISTNTGDFVGTYNSLAALEADNPNPNNNDYGYVVSTDQQGNTSYSRYKYSSNSQQWEFEYSLNNSSFTAEEWAAIQSGITSALVGKLSDLYTKAQLDVILDSKQSALTFDNVPTEGSDNPVKSGGIYNSLAQKQNNLTFDSIPVENSNNPVKSGGVYSALAGKQDELTFDNAPAQGSNNPVKSGGIYTALGNKQNVISDLATIRSGAAAGATAYQKPSTGIPETDLDASTQQKINNSVDISGKADKVTNATENDFAGLDANGNLKDSGKKASDFATAAQGALADTAYQLPSGGIPSTDLASAVQTDLGKAATAYQKPSGGIPDTDLSSAVQTSLGKADTAIQDVSGKADKVSGATSGDFAGLDANGNLTDTGKKASDFATSAQGALADTAYQLPSGGIPSTDLASGVQTDLGKAATAYQKPVGGIPDTDLSSAVQTSLGKADTAIQDVSGKADKVANATENDFAGLDANGNLKDSGKKASDFATAAQGALADTAYQKPSGGIPSTDLASAVQTDLGKAATAYQKPVGGIPDTDLSSAVQTSLGKADTAIQDVSGKADKVSGATENDFAGLDANGNLKDSGKKASDFATAAQGALADTAYQKPSGGIPSTDLASAVQTDLGKASTAYQKPSGGIPSSDMASAVQISLGKADTAYQKPAGGIPASDLASGVIPNIGLPVGAGTVNSLSGLPVTNRVLVATISANQSAVSISNGVSALTAGCELHIIIHATAAVTITLPTSSPYVNCNAESALEVASGGYAELNFVSDGTKIYVRGIV